MQQMKRFLAFCLAMVILITLLPTMAFAAESNGYISLVEIGVDKGQITVYVTPAGGHNQTADIYCMIYNKQEEDIGGAPALDNTLDVSSTTYQSATFIAEDVPSYAVSKTAVELTPVVSEHTNAGKLMFGSELRRYFIETACGLTWDDYKDATDQDLLDDPNIGMLPSSTWVVKTWSYVGGSDENYVETTFTLDDEGNLVTDYALDASIAAFASDMKYTGVEQTSTAKVTLKNSGAQALNDLSVAITDNTAGAFTIGGSLTSLAANTTDNSTLSVAFKGTKAGTYTANLVITNGTDTEADDYITKTIPLSVTIGRADLNWDNSLVFSASKPYDGGMTGATLSLAADSTIEGKNGETIKVALNGTQTVDYTDNADVGTNHKYVVTPAMVTFSGGDGVDMNNYNVPTDELNYSNGVIAAKTMNPTPTLSALNITYGVNTQKATVSNAPEGATFEYKIVAADTEEVSDTNWDSVTQDSTYATIAADGTITTVKVGTAKVVVKVTCTGYEDEYVIADLEISPATLKIEKTSDIAISVTQKAEASGKVKVTVNGAEAPAGVYSIKYTSGDQTKATVGETSGTVTGVAAGNTTVTATLSAANTNYTVDANNTADITVNVSSGTDNTVTFAKSGTSVFYGDNGNVFENAASAAKDTVTYGIVSETPGKDVTKIASVDNNGKVTIVGVGTVKITATSKGGDLGDGYYISDSASYTLEIKPRELTIEPGDYKIIKTYDGDVFADGTTDAASDGDLTLKGVYDEEGVTLDMSRVTFGNYNTKDAGTDKTITVSGIGLSGDADVLANYTLVSDSCTLTDSVIKAKPLTLTDLNTDGEVTKTYNGKLDKGTDFASTVTVKSSALEDDADNVTISFTGNGGSFDKANVADAQTFTFSKSDATLGGTDAGNYVLAEGNHTVNATINKAAQTLTLNPAGPLELYEERTSNTITVSSNTSETDWANVTVTSSNIANATVSKDKLTVDDQTFTITGVAKTTDDITIEVYSPETANYKEAKATINVEVKAANDPAVKFTANEQTVEYGSTLDFPAGAASDIAASDIKYSSLDENVAKVDANGKITPVNVGTTTIKAEVLAGDYNNKPYKYGSATYTLVVEPKKLSISWGGGEAPTIKLPNDTVNLGDGDFKVTALAYEDKPEDVYTVTYESQDSTKAAVDGNGLVSAKGAGSSIIKATLALKDENVKNYKVVDSTEQITVTVEKTEVELNDITVGKYTYNGTSQGPTVYATQNIGGTNYAVTVNYTGTTIGGDAYSSATAPTDAGSYKVTITLDENANYTAEPLEEPFTITKANLTWDTITDDTVTAEKPYDGDGDDAEAKGSLTVEGENGETFKLDVKADTTVTFAAQENKHDADIDYSYSLDWDDFTVTPNGSASLDNYNVPQTPLYYSNGVIAQEEQTTPSIGEDDTDDIIAYGDTLDLRASGGESTGNYVWTIIDGGDCATVGTEGTTVTLTAKKPGTVKVQVYKAGDTNYKQSADATYTLEITKRELTFAAQPGTLSVSKGETRDTNFVVTGTVADNDTNIVTTTYNSANTNYVTVDNTTGKVTGEAVTGNNGTNTVDVTATATLTGTAKEYYTFANDQDSATATVKVNVTSGKTNIVTFVNDTNPTINKEYGESLTNTATATSGTVKYKSSDETVATVDKDGVVTIKKVGENVTITAYVDEHPVTENGITTYYAYGEATYTLNVTAKPLTVSVEIDKIYDGNKKLDDNDADKLAEAILKDVLTDDKAEGKVYVTYSSDDVYGDANVTPDYVALDDVISLTGDKAGNYELNLNATGKVTPATVTVDNIPLEKFYNADVDLESEDVANATLNGVITDVDTDIKLAVDTAKYSSSDVGDTIAITGTFKLTGTNVDNYTLTQPNVTGKISVKELNVAGTKITKTYDGNADLDTVDDVTTINALVLADIEPTDSGKVTVDYTGVVYGSVNVADGVKDLAKQPTLAGEKAGNYKLTINPAFTGAIDPDTVTVSATTTISTKVGTAADLSAANVVVKDSKGNVLTIGDDYTLEYEVTAADNTGITVEKLTGTTTTAPTATGNATATVTVTLTGDNYVTDGSDKTEVVNLTVEVAEGQFKVKFNANEGTGSMADMTVSIGSNATNLTKNDGSITREGYNFKGWSYSATGSKFYEDGALMTNTTDFGDANKTPLYDKAEVTLYAVWEPVYALTVNAGDGGESPVGNGSYEKDEQVTINVTAKAGFTFKEWEVTSGTLTLTNPTQAEQTIAMPAGAVTLTPVFTSNLEITAKTEISKKTSEVANLKVSDFIATATPMFKDDSIATLFTDTVTVTGGVFTGNGVTIKFYNADGTPATDMNALPNTVGTYDYTVEVDGEKTGTPEENYNLQALPVASGKLTITKSSSGVGGGISGGGETTYTVTYAPGENGSFADGATTKVKVSKGDAPTKAPTVTADAGYKFLGWSKDGKTVVDLTKEKITKNTTYTALYAPYNNSDGDNHQLYMIGRDADSFEPLGDLTRAEAATMLARLTPGFTEDGTYTATSFVDMTTAHWAYKYICFAQSAGIISGIKNDDGTYYFDPDASVTRAEFSTMIVRFKNIAKLEQSSSFTDTVGHWSEGYVEALVEAGIIAGYGDGTFRPEQTINRAEAAKIVNGAIGRTPADSIDLAAAGYLNKFNDVNVTDWYFNHVMEATIDHAAKDFH